MIDQSNRWVSNIYEGNEPIVMKFFVRGYIHVSKESFTMQYLQSEFSKIMFSSKKTFLD